jgi:hypothetical protein
VAAVHLGPRLCASARSHKGRQGWNRTFPTCAASVRARRQGCPGALVTLRGVAFASVKVQVEQASEWLSVQAPAQSPTQSTGHPERWERPGWCSKHGVQMTQNHKDGRSWWSHKTAEGWCKGK